MSQQVWAYIVTAVCITMAFLGLFVIMRLIVVSIRTRISMRRVWRNIEEIINNRERP